MRGHLWVGDPVGKVGAEACRADHLGEELVEKTCPGAVLEARESPRDVRLADLDRRIAIHGARMLARSSRDQATRVNSHRARTKAGRASPAVSTFRQAL